MRIDILAFSRILSTRWQEVWNPGQTLVVDESVYEYLGESPCRIFIPRKPHPNGLLSYGISGYTSEKKMPILLDIEPWVPGNKLTARQSALKLVTRTCKFHPTHSFHVVMDSAFGSFGDVSIYRKMNVRVSMSMAETKKAWLWSLLSYKSPLDSGRTALIPFNEYPGVFAASSYRVKTENGKIMDLRTVSSSFEFSEPVYDEDIVKAVLSRRLDAQGNYEYETSWTDGSVNWLSATSFVDANGIFNWNWLEKADESDIKAALAEHTLTELISLADQKGWKVH